MKKNFITLLAIFLISTASIAQINLVGTSVNANGNIEIVKWQALDPSSVTRYPSGLDAYLFASSAFNSYNSNYYLSGISANSGVLLSFNTETNTSSLSNYSAFSNISEIDMSTGKIYNLTLDSVGYISVNEFDISTGAESLLGIIVEPGVNGIVADAIGFDSNNGILYYIGFDGSQSGCLYGIPVRNTVFSWTKTILLTTAAGNNFTSVNYDNVNNILYASNAQYDSTWNYTGNWVVEINTVTGEVIERGFLEGFTAYLAGSSSFDQYSGSFLLVGFDNSFHEKMIVFNTYDNTFVTGFVPPSVSEIICDNYSFARSTYITTSVQESELPGFSIFPNPAIHKFTICTSGFEENSTLRICDVSGKEYLSMKILQPGTEIYTDQFAKGLYVVTIQGKKGIRNQKLLIQ
jgi:hypothetical protein